MARLLSFIKAYRQPLVVYGLFLAGCLITYGGMMILSAPFAITQLVTLFRKSNQPAVKNRAVVKLILLVAVILIVITKYKIQEEIVQQRANELVVAIERYQQAHHSYPPNIQALDGWSAKRFRDELGFGAYMLDGGQPSVFYKAKLMPFDTWAYDFKMRRWEYLYD